MKSSDDDERARGRLRTSAAPRAVARIVRNDTERDRSQPLSGRSPRVSYAESVPEWSNAITQGCSHRVNAGMQKGPETRSPGPSGGTSLATSRQLPMQMKLMLGAPTWDVTTNAVPDVFVIWMRLLMSLTFTAAQKYVVRPVNAAEPERVTLTPVVPAVTTEPVTVC